MSVVTSRKGRWKGGGTAWVKVTWVLRMRKTKVIRRQERNGARNER